MQHADNHLLNQKEACHTPNPANTLHPEQPRDYLIRLIGQKVCPEQLFTLLRTGTLSCDAIRPRQAPLPISAERRPRLP